MSCWNEWPWSMPYRQTYMSEWASACIRSLVHWICIWNVNESSLFSSGVWKKADLCSFAAQHVFCALQRIKWKILNFILRFCASIWLACQPSFDDDDVTSLCFVHSLQCILYTRLILCTQRGHNVVSLPSSKRRRSFSLLFPNFNRFCWANERFCAASIYYCVITAQWKIDTYFIENSIREIMEAI